MKHYCIEEGCDNEVCYQTALYGQGRCRKCNGKINSKRMKGNKHGLIDGRCSKTYYCSDCGEEINWQSGIYGGGRCPSCAVKYCFKSGKLKYREINYCIDCLEKGIKIEIVCRAKRCHNCNSKYYSGKKSSAYGKIYNNKHIGRGKGDYYKGIWMRSSYEIKFAFFLDCNKIKWLYEPKAFDLDEMTYRPDFYLPEFDTYIEIKGYWRDIAKKKFRQFRKLYPNKNIKVLMKEDLEELGVL